MTEEIKSQLDYFKDEPKYLREVINALEQENKELKIYIESNKQQVEEVEMLVMDNDRLQQEVENLKDTIYYDVEKYRSALEKIKDLCIHYENTNDKCITNCYAHFIVTDLIQDKIN